MNKQGQKQIELIETRILWVRVFLLALLLVGLGVGIVLVGQSQETRQKAAEIVTSPSPLVDFIPPADELTVPSVRLVTPKDTYKTGETVPVYMYIDTGGKETMEADVSITFDPEVLEYETDKTEVSDVYKAYEINSPAQGKLDLAFFVTPEVGHEPVVTHNEERLAKLYFKALVGSEDKGDTRMDIEFKKGQNTASTLIAFTEERVRDPDNILESVAGTVFKISSE